MLGIITGMVSEARIFGSDALVVSAGGHAKATRDGIANLIARGADRLVSFGIAGALDPTLKPGDLIVASAVRTVQGERLPVDQKWLAHLPRHLTEARRCRRRGQHDHRGPAWSRKRCFTVIPAPLASTRKVIGWRRRRMPTACHSWSSVRLPIGQGTRSAGGAGRSGHEGQSADSRRHRRIVARPDATAGVDPRRLPDEEGAEGFIPQPNGAGGLALPCGCGSRQPPARHGGRRRIPPDAAYRARYPAPFRR